MDKEIKKQLNNEKSDEVSTNSIICCWILFIFVFVLIAVIMYSITVNITNPITIFLTFIDWMSLILGIISFIAIWYFIIDCRERIKKLEKGELKNG